MDWQMLLLANLAVCLGASVQTTVGYGMNLVAVPLMMAIDPSLVPGPILIAGLVLVLILTTSSRGDVSRESLTLATSAALPGAFFGAFALVQLSHLSLVLFTTAVLIGTTLLVARRAPLRSTPSNLLLAGFVSGFCGSTTSITGPPLAAVMVGSHRAASVRATLAAFLLLSTVISLAGLAWVGRFHWDTVVLSAMLLPGVAAGVVVANLVLRPIANAHPPRTIFLIASAGASTVFVIKEIVSLASG